MSYEDIDGVRDEVKGARFAQYEAEYASMEPVDVVKAMAAIRMDKDEREAELKLVQERYDFLRFKVVPRKFEEQDLRQVKIDGIGRCDLRGDTYVAIQPGKKDDAHAWLKDTGRESLIVPTVNSSTLKAAIKGALKACEDVPETIFRITPITEARITRT